jgi:hypothetical protein
MLAGQETGLRNIIVRGRGYGDADDIHERKEFVEGVANLGTVPISDSLCALRRLVVHRHEA